MANPIELFRELRETYLRYLDSPFDLRYEPLVDERRAMLDRDGRLYRAPLLEPSPSLCQQPSNILKCRTLFSAEHGRHPMSPTWHRSLARASFLLPANFTYISTKPWKRLPATGQTLW